MAVLKSYTCTKCAGVLIFDADQEYFDCPFCGTRFDSVDFHGDELLEQAEECLKKSEFPLAKEKLVKILEKDQSDFRALRGMILAEARVSTLEGLEDPDFYKRCRLPSVRKAVDSAVENAPEFSSGFFAKLSDMLAMIEKIDLMDNERRVINNSFDEKTVDRSREYLHRSRDSFKRSVMIMGAVVAFATLYHFLLMIAGGVSDWTVFWVIEGLMLFVYGAFFIVYYLISKKERRHDESPHEVIVNASNAANFTVIEVDEMKKEYVHEFKALKELDASANEALSGYEKANEADKETVDPDEGKTVLCSKCAAKLSLDKEKRVYQCNSCGVAYGISLFYGLPLEKALNSMNMGKYSDADQRFTNVLMVDPSDFDALLGRVLCLGKWTKVSGIGLNGELRPITFKKLAELLDKTVQSAAESDKAYFEKLKELITVLEELSMIDYKEKIADRQKKDLDIQEQFFATPYNNVRSANYKERWWIEEQNRPYVSKKKDREVKFARLKESLLGMKSGSMLSK